MLKFTPEPIRTLVPRAEHVRASVAWRIPEADFIETPLLRAHYVSAWLIIAAYLNGAPTVIEGLKRDVPSPAGDARLRWHSRLRAMELASNRAHDAVLPKFEKRLPRYVVNLYGISLSSADMAVLARELLDLSAVVASANDARAQEKALEEAAGRALMFAILGYRFAQTFRDPSSGEVDQDAAWGALRIRFSARNLLAQMGLVPVRVPGRADSLRSALLEEYAGRLTDLVKGAHTFDDNDGSLYAGLKGLLQADVKRDTASRAAPGGWAAIGTRAWPEVTASITEGLQTTGVQQQLILDDELVDGWRTMVTGELVALLQLFLARDPDHRTTHNYQRLLAVQHPDISALPLQNFTENGWRLALDYIAQYHTLAGSDRSALYTTLIAEIAQQRPGKWAPPQFRHVEVIRDDALFAAVHWPHARFTRSTTRRDGDATREVETTVEVALGAPMLAIEDRRFAEEELSATAMFIAPFANFRVEGGHDAPLQLDTVRAVPDQVSVVRTLYQSLIGGWRETLRAYAERCFRDTGSFKQQVRREPPAADLGAPGEGSKTRGKDRSRDRDRADEALPAGVVKIDWLAELGLLEGEVVREQHPGVGLFELPAPFVASLGIWLDEDLRPLRFNVLPMDQASPPLTSHLQVVDGYLVVDYSPNADPSAFLLELAKQRSFEAACAMGHIPRATLSGDSTVTPWKGFLDLSPVSSGWYYTVRSALLGLDPKDLAALQATPVAMRARLGTPLQVIATDLAITPPSGAIMPDAQLLTAFGSQATLLFKNPRRSLEIARYLERLSNPTLLDLERRQVRRALQGWLLVLLKKYLPVLQAADGEMAALITAFASTTESSEWLRVASKSPAAFARFEAVLRALIWSELAGEAVGFALLATSVEDSQRLISRVAMAPEFLNREKLGEVATAVQAALETPAAGAVAASVATLVEVAMHEKSLYEFGQVISSLHHFTLPSEG